MSRITRPTNPLRRPITGPQPPMSAARAAALAAGLPQINEDEDPMDEGGRDDRQPPSVDPVRAMQAEIEQEMAEDDAEEDYDPAPRRSAIPTRDPRQRAEATRRMRTPDIRGVLYIDPRDIPRGWSMEFKTETVHGQRNDNGLRQNMMEGWIPVLASEMPNYVSPLLPGETEADKFIRLGGQILMKRPIHMTREAVAAQRDETAFALSSLDRSLKTQFDDGRNFETIAETQHGFRSGKPVSAEGRLPTE